MSAAILLGLAALFGIAAWIATARPRLPSGHTLGGAALLIAAVGLALARQFALALPAGMMAITLLRRAGTARRATPRSGGVSEVRTDALLMRLDHDSGEMDGEILTGPLAGRMLSDLDAAELRDLAEEFEADPDSLGLLLAYIDRVGAGDAGPRDERADEPEAPGAGDGPMSAAEALRILGLKPGASIDEIRAAHRRLMKKVHPDLGGSNALAALINAAKARLDA